MTVNDCVNALQKELRLRRYCESSVKNYGSCIRVFARHFRKDPDVITVAEIKDFLLTIKTTAWHKQMNAAIHRYYDFVLKRPVSLCDLPYPRKERHVPEILTPDEVSGIIAGTANLKHRAIIQLIYSCALRTGEVVNVKMDHVHRTGLLRVSQGKGKKDRLVPVPDDTMDLLRLYYSKYRPKEYLFNGQGSLQYDVRSIQQVFHRSAARAGIRRNVTVHSLRHSRATHLVDCGIDISFIQKMLGHSNIKTTADFYLHTSVASLRKQVAMADGRLYAKAAKTQ